MNRELQLLNECADNPEFASRVYLEMLNQYPNLNMSFEDFEYFCESLRVRSAKSKSKAAVVTANTNNKIANNANKSKNSILRRDNKTKNKNARNDNITKNANAVRDAASEDKIRGYDPIKNAQTKNAVKDINLKAEMERDEIKRQAKKAHTKEVTDKISELANSAKDKYGRHMGRNSIIAGGSVAAVAGLSMIKDRKKYKAWKEFNPKKRKNVSYDQWVSLGKPLHEEDNAFIDGYFDALTEI